MRYDIAKLNLKQTVNINRNIDRRRELNSFIYCIQSNINNNNDSVDEIEIEIFHSLSLLWKNSALVQMKFSISMERFKVSNEFST